MELVAKAILLALTAGLAAAALQKSAPAIPLLLGIAAGAVILLLTMELASPILVFLRRARQTYKSNRKENYKYKDEYT